MITLVDNIEEANAITHAGSFHADDVFSTIFLSEFQDIYLYRANELTQNYPDKIIYDIGLGEFDHHGYDARVRENGIQYSSFGLLFEKYGKEYLKKKHCENIEECYETFLKEFILQIDAMDNGVFQKNPEQYNITSLSLVIELFNKTWKEEKETNEAFEEALAVGNQIFHRMEKRILDKMSAKKIVEKQIEKSENHILILEKYMPFMDFVLESKEEKAKEIYYCIYPSNRGGYNIQAIHLSLDTYQNRKDFPKEWGGKTKEELVKMTQIETFRFCHTGLFLCASETLPDAISIAKRSIQKETKKE